MGVAAGDPKPKPLYPKHEGCVVLGVIAVLATVFLMLASNAGCVRKPTPVSIVTPVQISWPQDMAVRPSCWIDEPPIPPEEINTLMAEDDIVRRVFVHIRQFNELVVWAKDTLQWMTVMKACVDQMHE